MRHMSIYIWEPIFKGLLTLMGSLDDRHFGVEDLRTVQCIEARAFGVTVRVFKDIGERAGTCLQRSPIEALLIWRPSEL
jgi:hypothetical protein